MIQTTLTRTVSNDIPGGQETIIDLKMDSKTAIVLIETLQLRFNNSVMLNQEIPVVKELIDSLMNAFNV
jgi:hypothetical protein